MRGLHMADKLVRSATFLPGTKIPSGWRNNVSYFEVLKLHHILVVCPSGDEPHEVGGSRFEI